MELDMNLFPEEVPDVVSEIDITPEGAEQEDAGVASMITSCIATTWENIDTVNAIIASTNKEDVKNVLQSASNTLLAVIGQYQAALKLVSPNVDIVSDSEDSVEELGIQDLEKK